MNRFETFARQKWAVVRASPLVWCSLGLFAGTAAVLWIWPSPVVGGTHSDTRLRMWALFLQLLGGVAALVDLTQGASEHGHPGIIRNFLSWVRALVYGDSAVAHISGAVARADAGQVRGKGRRSMVATQPTEKRLDDLEYNVNELDRALDVAFKELDKRAGELKTRIDNEVRQREAAVSEIKQQTRDAALRNYALLVFGAFWVLVGAVLSTLSSEIVRIIAGQGAAVWRAL